MELRHLRYFIAVAEEGSLTLAAEKRLHTAQPSLSRQIRDLEEEVGVQLITRSVHGIELTAAGRAFLDHARLAVTQAEAAKEAARRSAQPTRPAIALGFLSGTEMDLLPKVMRVLQDELPNIEVKLSSDYSPRLAEALLKGRLDAAFMRPEPHAGDLVYRLVRTEPLIVVFPNDHRFAARKAIRLREIKGEPFIKPSKTAPTLRKIIEGQPEAFRPGHSRDPRGAQSRPCLLHDRIDARCDSVASVREELPPFVCHQLPHPGDAPTVDLVVGYNKANTAHVLKLFLERVDILVARE